MSKGKIALFTVIFTAVAFVAPMIIMLIFVPADNIGVYLAVFGIIFFASLGFVVANAVAVKKEVIKNISEIKVQNAAIAYKLAKNKKELSEILGVEEKDIGSIANPEEKTDYSKVNLNPEIPVEVQTKPAKKIVDDNFDDFK